MEKKIRKTKYEALRIISMFMIVLAHYAYHGGVMFKGSVFNQIVGSVLAIGGKLGVNLFVIIGSYFLVDKQILNLRGGYSAVCKLFIQTTVVSVCCWLIYSLQDSRFTIREFVSACLSFFRSYWYMLPYCLLVIFSPLINMALERLEKGSIKELLLTLFIVVCVIQNILNINAGSYLITFILIYITIYYIKKYNACFNIKKVLGLIIICVVIQALYELFCILRGMDKRAWLIDDSGDFLIYVISICFFVVFDKLKIQDNQFINLLGSNTLMVYLIHDNMFLRSIVWKLAKPELFFCSSLMLLHGIVVSTVILAGGIIIGVLYSSLSQIITKS